MKSFQKERNSILHFMQRVLDVLALLFAAKIASEIHLDGLSFSANYQVALLISVFLLIIVFHSSGMYRAWRGSSRSREVAEVIVSLLLVFACLAILSVALKLSAYFSRLWFFYWFLFSVVGIASYRLLFRMLLSKLRKHGINVKKIALIGDSNSVTRAVKELQQCPWLGIQPAILHFTQVTGKKLNTHSLELSDDYSSIISNVVLNEVNEIWIALPIAEANVLKKILDQLSILPCPVRYIPDFFGFDLINHSVTEVGRLPIVNLSVSPIDGMNGVLKWLEDKALSVIILVVVSPLIVLVAAGIKITSPGPVFYKQERVSWNGKRFYMLKFRSMPVDTENSGVKWGRADEKTTTKFGAFIRKTSLDELPQFINVLVGDMSIVGPRPERTEFVERFKSEIPRYMQKHMVKGGITGWAQVQGWRGDTDLRSRIEADLCYIEKWSLWLDLKIVALTLYKVFNDKSAK